MHTDRSLLSRVARRCFPILLLALLFVLSGCSFGNDAEIEINDGSTLVVDLAGEYVEAASPSALARLTGNATQSFVTLLSLFNMAERDDRIETVVLKIQPLQMGWGKADEIRAAIARLNEKGRHTVAYVEVQALAANKELFVASAAKEVFVAPGSVLPLVGLAAEYLHLGGFWEKVGVEFEVAKAGRYKSAVEIYSERGMSEASREMANSLLDDTFERFAAGLAEGRGLPLETVKDAIDRGSVRNQQLEAFGLIDGEMHLDQLLARFGDEVVTHSDYAGVDPSDLGFDAQREFALIYGTGTVVQGRAGNSPLSDTGAFASETVSEAILEAAEDDTISAIIFRIDSPGGSALASELIWRAVRQAQEAGKPVIASFSDVAASGGYYVASAADAIVSDPGTLTGSIGVFSLRPIVGGLLDKLDVGVDSVSRGRHADFLLSSERLSEASMARLQTSVLDTYQLFLTRVSDGRSLSLEAVDRVGQGRVWTGAQAYEVGLVDELGGLHTAVRRAKEQIGLSPDEDVYLVPYPRAASLSEQIFAALQDASMGLRAPAVIDWPEPIDQLMAWTESLPAGTALLIPPMSIEIR